MPEKSPGPPLKKGCRRVSVQELYSMLLWNFPNVRSFQGNVPSCYSPISANAPCRSGFLKHKLLKAKRQVRQNGLAFFYRSAFSGNKTSKNEEYEPV